MMDKEQFIEYVLTGGPESASDKDTSTTNVVRPKGFAGKGFQPKEKKSAEPTNRQSTFAKRLLEAAGFGVPEEVARGTLIRGDDAAARYLPERVFYWPKTSERPYQTLLFEADVTHRELLAIPAFRNRKMDHLDVVEDALARLVQQSLRGFERGGEGVTAAIKKGRQDETLCIVSIVDERDSQPVRLVCFGTMNAKNEGLETFQITEQTRYWEPQLARDYLGLLYQRQFGRLEGSGWQDAFTTTEERKLAQKLLEVCSKSRPKEADIQESVLDLLDEIAKSFGLRRKPGQDRRLLGQPLPLDHDIGIDPDAIGRSSKTANPFQGIAIHDEKNRLLGYIVYCLDRKKDAEELRARLERHNRFHNVLVVYPDGDEAALELWQGNEPLVGKLRKDGAQFRGGGEVVNLLSRFFVVSKSKVKDPEGLAEELAYRARYLRTLAIRQMEAEGEDGPLQKLYHAFRDALIHDQTEEQFADSYAQTLTYGLLTARWVSKDEYAQSGERFTRQNAVDHLHVSHGFLRDFYRSALKATSSQSRLTWLLDDIANLLDRISIDDVFTQKKDADDPWSGDPVIHFYEPFLNKYDAAARQRRGVYYTPRPVVSYIVRSVHELLQTEFGLADGLADTTTWGEMLKKHPGLKLPPLTDEPGEKRTISPDEPFVQILDPATGTGTFLVEVIDVIHRTLAAKWKQNRLTDAQQRVAWNDYVPKHLLTRLHAFELMMAPYAIAHMKIGLKLAETGYRFGIEERARIYLTNALEPWVKQLPLIGFDALAHEAAAVNEIKRHKRFTVVIGNPPYSGISSNMTDDAQRIVDAYKIVDGGALNERKLWLQDDYVKFIRKAQTIIDSTKVGVFGYITNHGYLDNPTFRGMRQSLMGTFPRLCVLDLHGNSNKKEQSPDGSVDKPVFDIKQGVAICLATRGGAESGVAHSELWGSREAKYAWLVEHRASDTEFTPLTPDSPFYFFERQNTDCRAEYDVGWKINDAMPANCAGFITARDHFVVALDKETLLERIGDFANLKFSDAEIRARYFEGCGSAKYPDGDSRGWKVPLARRRVAGDKKWRERVRTCLYRPFDSRPIYWADWMVDWPRPEVMRHMFAEHALALSTSRSVEIGSFEHVLCTRLPLGHHTVSLKEVNYMFPLYLLPDDDSQHSLALRAEREPNFAPAFLKDLSASLKLTQKGAHGLPAGLTPEDIFHYAYAVFHSPGYRSRYAEFLKIDFPRLPLAGNLELFRALARLGGELTALHLLESPKLAQPITEFIGSRLPLVEKISWSKNTVWVDKGQTTGFQGVSEDVWNFHIGGYKVCEKWLKDRKGRSLNKDDITHYQKIVVALSETIRLMKDIDKVIEKHGGWPGAFAQSSTVKAAK